MRSFGDTFCRLVSQRTKLLRKSYHACWPNVPTSPRLSVRRMKLPSLRRACLSSLLHKSIRLESVQKANLEVVATHDPLTHTADLGAEPIPELEFDQTVGWRHCTTEVIVRAARRVRVHVSFWWSVSGAWGCEVPVACLDARRSCNRCSGAHATSSKPGARVPVHPVTNM